ncbi:hypothetical protein HETIRDRAFT_103690 [Heterobasidion irregulare TC 32-1]|uniref:Uncharacterized protein n=1 Tax=Heterobasidion irregulare (strain TC 32-1) TaxID=747525 RepID=W4K2W3_HETIT|nr:uncharacterized protein HETIRDRAFT_103690 [Heterobasidion irregulare TC 32-1]ETW79690.1 hypothetical protein HETIRDRAFT_103690 [Heterobasidion irregulare TC 32-1]
MTSTASRAACESGHSPQRRGVPSARTLYLPPSTEAQDDPRMTRPAGQTRGGRAHTAAAAFQGTEPRMTDDDGGAREDRARCQKAADTTTVDSLGPSAQRAPMLSPHQAVELSRCRAAEPSTRGTRICQTSKQQSSGSIEQHQAVKPSTRGTGDRAHATPEATPRGPVPAGAALILASHAVTLSSYRQAAQTERCVQALAAGAPRRAVRPAPQERVRRCPAVYIHDTSGIAIQLAERTSNNKGSPLAPVFIRPPARPPTSVVVAPAVAPDMKPMRPGLASAISTPSVESVPNPGSSYLYERSGRAERCTRVVIHIPEDSRRVRPARRAIRGARIGPSRRRRGSAAGGAACPSRTGPTMPGGLRARCVGYRDPTRRADEEQQGPLALVDIRPHSRFRPDGYANARRASQKEQIGLTSRARTTRTCAAQYLSGVIPLRSPQARSQAQSQSQPSPQIREPACSATSLLLFPISSEIRSAAPASDTRT